MHHRRLLGNATPAATELPFNNDGNRTSHAYIRETNFDTNMVIILAALLCALICALSLNSIVRCALRCGHRFALESPEQAATRLAATGLKKSHLRQLPIAIYGEQEEEGMHIPATECPICLGEFVEGEKVRVLPKCKHGFHVRCIDTWLASHSSCPNCRHSLLEHQQLSNKTRTTTSRGSDVITSGSSSEAIDDSSAASNGESDQDGRVVLVIDE